MSDEVKGAEDAGAEAAEKAEEAEEAKEEREAAKAEGAGEASDCDEMGRPLFDPSPFEGLPKQAIQTICGMFFNSQSDFGCHAQLLAIRDSVVGGEMLSPGDPNCMLGRCCSGSAVARCRQAPSPSAHASRTTRTACVP